LTTTKRPTCPECGKKYNSAKGLGFHRRVEHGVLGTASSTVAAQKKRQRYLATFKRDAKGSILCPECGEAFTATGISNHRKLKHGLSSAQQRAMALQIQPATVAVIETTAEPANPLKCSQCDFVAVNKRGIRVHVSTRHATVTQREMQLQKRQARKNIEPTETKAIVVSSSNGSTDHRENWQGHTDGIPEALIAVASGRFTELCRSMAYEHDVPARLFAARVAAFVYATTIR
jgi:uncharacterized C2H2 Zn-finger protein